MRKALALIATIALVMGMFTGLAFAAAPTASVGIKADESNEAGASSIIEVTITPDGTSPEAIYGVRIDFAGKGFVPTGAPTSSVEGTGAVNNTEATYTLSDPAGSSASFKVEIPVRNPEEVGAVTGFSVEVLNGSGAWVGVTTSGSVDIDYTVEVTPEDAVIGATSPVTVIIKEAGQIVDGTDLQVTIKDADGNIVARGWTSNGRFNASVSFGAPAVPTAPDNALLFHYTVEVSDLTDNGAAKIPVKYDLQLDPIGDVYYKDVKVISGKLLDGNGDGLGNYKINIKNGGSIVAYAYTASDGSFTVQALFGDATTFDIEVEKDALTADYGDIVVKPLGLDVTASDDLLGTVGNDILTLTAGFGGTPAENAEFTITGPEGYAGATSATADASGQATIDQIWLPGEYTVDVVWEHGNQSPVPDDPDRTATITFTVASPEKLNYSVTPDTLTPGPGQAITIEVKDASGNGVKGSGAADDEIASVYYEITGPVSADVTFESDNPADFSGTEDTTKVLNVDIEKGGVITVTGTVTFGDGSTESFEETIEVDGYLITTDKVLGTVGDIVALRAVVTDANGVPVNNAVVTWAPTAAGTFFVDSDGDGEYDDAPVGGTLVVSASDTNISNGVYEITAKLAKADDSVDLTVTNIGGGTTFAAFATQITGEQAYTVSVDKANLIASYAQDLVITVKDAGGDFVTNLTGLTVKGAGLDESLSNAVLFDADEDSFYDSYKFTDLKATEVGDIVITASTDGGNKIGTAEIGAAAPAVEMPDVLTEGIEEEITISLKDMGADDFLAGNVRVTVEGGQLVAFNDGDSTNYSSPQVFTGANEYTFFAVGKDVVESGDAVAPVLKVEVAYDGSTYIEVGEIAIQPAEVSANIDELFIGINNKLEITVNDAHGNPLADRDVTLSGAASAAGSTDDSGLVQLTVTPNSTGTVTITINGDSGETITDTIKAVADTVKPEISLDLPAITTEDSVLLKGLVSDNTNIDKIYVNNEPVLFIPGSEVDLETVGYSVDLEPGVNTIRVFVFDTAGNGAYVTETVTRREAKEIRMVLNDPNVTVNGETSTLDQAPIVENGRTLVPLRFIGEALGGYVAWNTPIASVSIGGKLVEVSTVETWAAIDGVEVDIDVPGKILNGRTLVPVRFIAEAFGAQVTYHKEDRSIDIVY